MKTGRRRMTDPGRTLERLREAGSNLLSEFTDQGGQIHEQTRNNGILLKTKLNIDHSQKKKEDTGRPGEANEELGGGQRRDELFQGRDEIYKEKGGKIHYPDVKK